MIFHFPKSKPIAWHDCDENKVNVLHSDSVSNMPNMYRHFRHCKYVKRSVGSTVHPISNGNDTSSERETDDVTSVHGA